MSKLIVLVGKAGSGKTAIAKELKEQYGGVVISFATPIRDMFYALGLTEQHLKGDLKEVPCDILSGATPRYAMQTLGKEWARDFIHKDFWINIWQRKVEHNLQRKFVVITDDCRFANEEEAVRDLGGIIIRIHRDIREIETASHASESYIDKIKEDFNVDNNRPVIEVVNDILGLI